MVDPGTFILYDAVRPALDDGDYTLATQQSIADTAGTAAIPPVSPGSWNFRIVGPRFSLPPDQLLSCFPPPDGQGEYSDRLPQVVLRRRTLPYERRVVTTDDPATEVGRAPMTMGKPGSTVETLKITLSETGGNKGTVLVEFENVTASVPFTVK
jgi:hypothetical protein